MLRKSVCKVVIILAVSTMLKMLTSTNAEDIPPNCFDQFNVEMKRETEESSSQEAQLEDKLVNIFEANSEK